jgi:four helix bundle protein
MDLINKTYQFPFEKLEIWQLAINYSIYIRKMTKSFPKEELYNATNQLCRAASSVCTNIAEGAGRKSNNDKARFMEIAFGSLMETMSLTIENHLMGYLDDETLENVRKLVHELSNKINALYNTLKK